MRIEEFLDYQIGDQVSVLNKGMGFIIGVVISYSSEFCYSVVYNVQFDGFVYGLSASDIKLV